MGLQRIGKIVDVDDHLFDPGGAQPVEDMIEQRLAANLDQRLGAGRGQRPHPLAEPGGHDHRGGRDLGRDFRAKTEGALGLAHLRIFPRCPAVALGNMGIEPGAHRLQSGPREVAFE